MNTGWTGGAYGVGIRMPIKDTRAVLTAVLENTLSVTNFRTDENFGFQVPVRVKGIDSQLLSPRETWPIASEYDKQARKLVKMFAKNFDCYRDYVDESILAVAL